ncbi:hypothetical protein CPB85DRAFT_850313 [Mucidula mucida]|nr:hypothetical protein CPB85DRAFT_850313 [Mucidula mucida]
MPTITHQQLTEMLLPQYKSAVVGVASRPSLQPNGISSPMRGLRLFSSLASLAVARAFPNGFRTMRSVAPPIDSDAVPAQLGLLKTQSEGDDVPPYAVVQYFDQPIDHNDLSLGTFEQRYWLNDEFYKPGQSLVTVHENFPKEND